MGKKKTFRNQPRHQWTEEEKDALIELVESEEMEELLQMITETGRTIDIFWTQIPGRLGIPVTPVAAKSMYSKAKADRQRSIGEQVEHGELQKVLLGDTSPIVRKIEELIEQVEQVNADATLELIQELRALRGALVDVLNANKQTMENIQAALEMQVDQFEKLLGELKEPVDGHAS